MTLPTNKEELEQALDELAEYDKYVEDAETRIAIVEADPTHTISDWAKAHDSHWGVKSVRDQMLDIIECYTQKRYIDKFDDDTDMPEQTQDDVLAFMKKEYGIDICTLDTPDDCCSDCPDPLPEDLTYKYDKTVNDPLEEDFVIIEPEEKMYSEWYDPFSTLEIEDNDNNS